MSESNAAVIDRPASTVTVDASSGSAGDAESRVVETQVQAPSSDGDGRAETQTPAAEATPTPEASKPDAQPKAERTIDELWDAYRQDQNPANFNGAEWARLNKSYTDRVALENERRERAATIAQTFDDLPAALKAADEAVLKKVADEGLDLGSPLAQELLDAARQRVTNDIRTKAEPAILGGYLRDDISPLILQYDGNSQRAQNYVKGEWTFSEWIRALGAFAHEAGVREGKKNPGSDWVPKSKYDEELQALKPAMGSTRNGGTGAADNRTVNQRLTDPNTPMDEINQLLAEKGL